MSIKCLTLQWLLLSENSNGNSFTQGTVVSVVSLIFSVNITERKISVSLFVIFIKHSFSEKERDHEKPVWQRAGSSRSAFS